MKNQILKRSRQLCLNFYPTAMIAAAVIGGLGFVSNAQAELVMSLYGNSGSSIVRFELSGSDVMVFPEDHWVVGAAGAFFYFPEGFDAFPPSGDGLFYLQSGDATWTDLTTGDSDVIESIVLRDGSYSGSVDRFGVSLGIPGQNAGSYQLINGNTFGWSGAGTIDLSEKGLSFDDIRHASGVGQMNFEVIHVYGLLNARLVVVPEPFAASFLSFLLGPVVFRRPKR